MQAYILYNPDRHSRKQILRAIVYPYRDLSQCGLEHHCGKVSELGLKAIIINTPQAKPKHELSRFTDEAKITLERLARDVYFLRSLDNRRARK